MRFGRIQKRKFGTDDGAYSIVTKREHFDSQITLTDYEAEIVISHFGKENLHVGKVQSNPSLSSKQFRRFSDGKMIKININYPKPKKPELRLYISSKKGFKPDAGDIWFMFSKDGEIWIGAMPESEWRNESSELKQDESDEVYQSSINDTNALRIAKLKGRDVYARNRNIAIKRMEFSGFTCEFDSSHNLFISRFSNKRYLEAHHLVPMGLQGEFKKTLDTIHNIFCLCPFCHRAVHHAEKSLACSILESLSTKGPILQDFELSLPDLFSLYAVEEIE